MTKIDGEQNVSGTSSNVGFFFNGFVGAQFNDLEIGWLANGPGLVNAVVISIDRENYTITIEQPNIFMSGSVYSFTAPFTTAVTNGGHTGAIYCKKTNTVLTLRCSLPSGFFAELFNMDRAK